MSDTKAPQVLSFAFVPGIIDTSTDSQQILFTAQLTDDLSGVEQGDGVSPSQAVFVSPSGKQQQVVIFSALERTAGDNLDGTYYSSMVVPQYSEAGTWTLQSFFLVDEVGNTRLLGADQLSTMGFATEFTVHSVVDTEAPQVVNFSLSPHSIDTSSGSQQILFTAQLTDNLSGVEQGDGVSPSQVVFVSPSGKQRQVAPFSAFEQTAGDSLNGTYQSSMTLPQYSEAGTWTLQSLLLVDEVGNTDLLDVNQLSSMGFTTEFTVNSVVDTEAPQVSNFSLFPKNIDTSIGSQQILFTAQLTDNLSGVEKGDGVSPSQAMFVSPSGQQHQVAIFSSFERTEGNPLDGTYRSSMTLPQYSEAGTWTLWSFLLVDEVGNTEVLNADQLSAMGFTTEFVVEGLEVVPPIAPSDPTPVPTPNPTPAPTPGLISNPTPAPVPDLTPILIPEPVPGSDPILPPSPPVGLTEKGTKGNDQLIGDIGDDVLKGKKGKDFLSGGEGDDLLVGGLGRDRYLGGAGSDTVLFKRKDLFDRPDIFLDFEVGADLIDIGKVFKGRKFKSNAPLDDFMRLNGSRRRTVVAIDSNGNLPGTAFEKLIVLKGVDANSIDEDSFLY